MQTLETVLLDSGQSQANRMEWPCSGRTKRPGQDADAGGRFQRAAGAIRCSRRSDRLTALRRRTGCAMRFSGDAVYQGQKFRALGPGGELNGVRPANATSVSSLSDGLIFGFWDSTGPRGGLGAKIQRALVSRWGTCAKEGKRPLRRIDPLQIENNVEIYHKVGGGWTMDEAQLAAKFKGEPKN